MPETRRRPARTTAPAVASADVAADGYHVKPGDTLSKIAHGLQAVSRGEVDQTMIAIYQNNPQAFGGNINVLRQGSILRVPGADEIAALNQKEAISEVSRQMSAWRNASWASESPLVELSSHFLKSSGVSTTTSPIIWEWFVPQYCVQNR